MQMDLAQNYFQLFKIPISFEIDIQQLAASYREWQQSVHPDRFANASTQEKRYSMQLAAHINEAFQVLKSPQRRARYILELQGVKFDDQKNPQMDPVFLMEQMELREALSEVKQQSDPDIALQTFLATLKSKQQQLYQAMMQQLKIPEQGDLSVAQQLVHEIQFLDKLQSEAELIEEELLDSL